MLRFVATAATALFTLSLSAVPAGAQSYPDQAIRGVVPFEAGTGMDNIARLIEKGLADRKLLPQPLVIVNVPGGTGFVGAQRVKDAQPDGYTFLMLHLSLLAGKELLGREFGAEAFEPVATTGDTCPFVMVKDDAPEKTLKDLLEKAKAEPNTLIWGSNIGSGNQFSALTLELASGALFRHVQTGGATKNLPALLGGHIQAASFSSAESPAYGQKGVRTLGYLSEERHPGYPDIPTAREQGFDVVACQYIWWFAPLGTPQDRIDVFAGALEKLFKDPTFLVELDKSGALPEFKRGEAVRQQIETERQKLKAFAPRFAAMEPPAQ